MSDRHPRRSQAWLLPIKFTPPLIALLLFLFVPSVALAHAYPVASHPAPDTSLRTTPSRVEITFDESVEPRFASVVVYDASRKQVQVGRAKVDSGNPRVVTVGVPPHLARGSYTVVWHVVAADDGHSTAGVFVFGVGEAAQLPAITAQQLGAAQGSFATPVGVLGRWLTYLGAILVLGTSGFALAVVRLSSAEQAGGDRLRTLIFMALATLLAGQVLRLVDEHQLAAGSHGGAQASLTGLVLDSRFGTLWLARAALLGLAALLVACRGRWPKLPPRLCWSGLLIVGFGLVVNLAWSGHAASGDILAYVGAIQATLGWAAPGNLYLPIAAAVVHTAKTVTLVVDVLHLIGASIWIGGLIALAVVSSDVARPDEMAPLRSRFSRIALGAMILVLLTGIYNGWLYLDGPRSYLATGYGQSLLLKHVAIIGMLLLAGMNHFVVTPVLTGRREPAQFSKLVQKWVAAHPLGMIRAEAVMGIVVLLCTGLLTSLGPARTPDQILIDPRRELALAREPLALHLTASGAATGPLAVRFEASPGRLGPNDFSVDVRQADQPSGAVRRASLAFEPIDLAPSTANAVNLRPTGPGHFAARSLALGTSGVWRVTIRLGLANGRTATAQATLQVTPTWAAPLDPRATKLLDQAYAAMAKVHSAQMEESLSDGAGGLVLNSYTFKSPDRLAITSPNGGAAIHIGSKLYQRSGFGRPWTVSNASPYTWPAGDFNQLRKGVGGIIVGDGTVRGVPCTVVAFYSTRVNGIYEEWIGKRDHLIHQEIMAAPSHFMVDQYVRFNSGASVVGQARALQLGMR